MVARTAPLARLKRVTGRASAAKLGKLGASASGTLALSAWHDEPVVIPSILNKLGNSSEPWETTVAHLDVPAGKYVVVAKARALNTNPGVYTVDETAGVLCFLAAGADSDVGGATHWNMLSLTVVHVFPKPGRIELELHAGDRPERDGTREREDHRDPGHHPRERVRRHRLTAGHG